MDAFTKGYLTTALWLADEKPGSGEWSEREPFTIANIDTGALNQAFRACKDFQEYAAADLEEYATLIPRHPDYAINERAGGDFYLSRNGHGAGFFDRGDEPVFSRLQAAAKIWSTWELYLGDDGKLYGMG